MMQYVVDVRLKDQAQGLIHELSEYEGSEQFPQANVKLLRELLQVFLDSIEKDILARRDEYLLEALKVADDVIRRTDLLRHKGNGDHEYEFYPDYREELAMSDLAEVMDQDDPLFAFADAVWTSYEYSIVEAREQVHDEIVRNIEETLGMADDINDNIDEIVMDRVRFKLPYSHFLQQEVHVPIMLDLGDGNYDYTLNRLMAPNQDHAEPWMDDRASMLWLAKQQGYTKEQLVAAMQMQGSDIKDLFLLSACEEMDYIGDGIGQLVFLTKLTVRELLALRTAMKRGTGSITITDPFCGLFDKCNGSGGMDLKVPHPVEIPVSIIQSAEIDLPHSGHFGNYGIQETFEFVEGVWKDSEKLHLEFKIPDDILSQIDWLAE